MSKKSYLFLYSDSLQKYGQDFMDTQCVITAGMDTLAAILNKLNRPRELDTLATRLMGIR